MFRRRPQPRRPVRITGIVRAMNEVRAGLAAGVPPAEHDAFRAYVRQTVADVERICRDAGARIEDLPPQTRSAYRYLHELDLRKLPVPADGAATAGASGAGRLRVSNLVAITTHYRRRLLNLAGAPDGAEALATIRNEIARHVAEVDRIAAENGASPATLPPQSRDAYAWLRFLLGPGNLDRHAQTLADLAALARRLDGHPGRPAGTAQLPVTVDLYHMPSLFRTRRSGQKIEIVAGEVFVDAPAGVLDALVRAALGVERNRRIGELRAYTRGDHAGTVLRALTLRDDTPDVLLRGRHYDLSAVFDRVNRTHFAGRLDRPRLVWSRAHTRRTMGHFAPATDTILLSVTLDDPAVPIYVVDFVMYHELLHRVLGAPVVNGRTRAHTAEFRRREAAFPDYARARRWLDTRK